MKIYCYNISLKCELFANEACKKKYSTLLLPTQKNPPKQKNLLCISALKIILDIKELIVTVKYG